MKYFSLSKFFIFISVLAIAIVTISTLFPFIVGKYVWFRTSVDLALIFFLLGLLFQDKFLETSHRLMSIFKKPLVIAVSVFVLIFLLACFFGIDPKMSFWSNFERGEGGLQVLHFYVFFLLLITLFKEEKDWQRMFVMAIIGGLGMAFYGLLAGWGTENFVGIRFGDPGFRFQGSIGNPAYVAAYAIFMLFYAAYLLLKNAELRGQTRGTTQKSQYVSVFSQYKSVLLWFLIVLFSVVFFAAATRGAFMGFIASIIVFVSYLAFSSRRWRKWLLSVGVIVLLIVGLLIYFKNVSFIKSLPFSRVFDISFSAKTFEDRAIMWQVAIDGWKERPVLGWGPENYLKIFDRHFNIKYFVPSQGFGAWFDRAHSVYFDYLAETGILGILSFLSIWIVFYWQFIKKFQISNSKFKIQNSSGALESALLFALPVAYLVQGIVLFDVFPIYMNIFLFMAFASYKFNLKSQI